jgi:hypothetical protein
MYMRERQRVCQSMYIVRFHVWCETKKLSMTMLESREDTTEDPTPQRLHERYPEPNKVVDWLDYLHCEAVPYTKFEGDACLNKMCS